MKHKMSAYTYGTVLMIVGVLILSPDSGVLRLIDGDPYVIAFWRGVGACVVMWSFALLKSPAEFFHQLTTLSWISCGIMFSFGMSSMAFVLGVTYLGAPTMLVFISMTPLASAFASWLIFKERTDNALWLAIIFAIIGALIAGSAIPQQTPLEGWLAAILVPGLTGLGISLTRHHPGDTIWPIYGAASLIVAGVLWSVLPSVDIPQGTEWLVAFNACITVPVSFVFITIAPKYLPAPEVGLYLLLETLIGPVIVWILVFEVPRQNDYIGGGILLTALIGLFTYRMRQSRHRILMR